MSFDNGLFALVRSIDSMPVYVLTERLAASYHAAVERWLRSIGVNEQTIHEYEFRTHQYQIGGELWRGGVKVGEVVTRLDGDHPETGLRLVVECTPPGNY